MRYERLKAISNRHEKLLVLIGHGAHSSRNLAKELAVSEQTVYRDVLFLKNQGHSIRAVRLLTSWAYQLLPTEAHKQPSGKRAI